MQRSILNWTMEGTKGINGETGEILMHLQFNSLCRTNHNLLALTGVFAYVGYYSGS